MKICVRCSFEKAITEFATNDKTCKNCRKLLRLKKPIEVAPIGEGIELHISITDGVIHCYDDTDWIVECYSKKMATFATQMGAIEIPTIHDGQMFKITQNQLLGFTALLCGLGTRKAKALVDSTT
jgi:hypothetical protein